MSMVTFAVPIAERLRERAAEAAELPADTPGGWSVRGPGDVERLVAIFDRLTVKAGYVLRAYQFRDGGNANGFVYALPAGMDLPAPEECPRLRDKFLDPPRPPAALGDAMQVIEGDGSLLSYLQASLLKRELLEFGALWHGLDWRVHTILGEDPRPLIRFGNGTDLPSGPAEEWTWSKRLPRNWMMNVRTVSARVRVAFQTFSGHGEQMIHRFVDTYQPGTYQCRTRHTVLGRSPAGYDF